MGHRTNLLVHFILASVLICRHLVRTNGIPNDTSTAQQANLDEQVTTTSAEEMLTSPSSTPPSTTTEIATAKTTTTPTDRQTTATTTTTTPTDTQTTASTTTPPPSKKTKETTPKSTSTAETTRKSTTVADEEAASCASAEESFFGKHGLLAFVVAAGVVLLLLYTILMLLLLPRILKRRKGGKYSLNRNGRKSTEHHRVAPLVLGDEEDSQSTSKVMDPGPLMLVTALDSVVLTSDQEHDEDGEDDQTDRPLTGGQKNIRKDSSDQANVSTFLLRQTSIREAQERKRAEAEAEQKARNLQQQSESAATTAVLTTGSSTHMDGNDNLCHGAMMTAPLYESNNDITEV